MNTIQSHLSSELRLYGGLFAAWLVGLAVFGLDHYQAGRYFPPGTITVALECLLEVSSILALLQLKRPQPEYRWFLWFFCFLLPTDISYLVLHYILRVNQENWVSFWITTLPYSICYALASIGFYKHIRPRVANTKAMSFAWLPMLLIIPAIFGILIPQLLAHYRADGWTFDLTEIALNSIFAVVLFFWATVALMLSLDRVFPFLGLAGIISQLGNWGGVTAYLSNKNTFTFSEYEYLWLCGIITFWYAVAVIGRRTVDGGDARPGENLARGKSLVVQERMILIGLISASLIVAVLLSPRNAWSYRIVFFGIGIGSFIAMFLGDMLSKQIVRYATLFGEVVNPTEPSGEPAPPPDDVPSELWQVYQAAFHEKMVEHRMKEAVRRNMAELATQVAHDIRSPLFTLDQALKDAARLPEAKRVLVRGAVTRIHDIADSLLNKHREGACAQDAADAPAAADTETSLLSALLESIIAEKRLRHRSRANVEIRSTIDDSSCGLFGELDPAEFKRVLSNLIDNAVEAIDPARPGFVTVRLGANDDRIAVTVEDNGKGISPDLLAGLGQKGLSRGKPNGCGLGIYHAKTCAKSWGGELTITSEPGKGTSVVLILPQVPAPDWDAVLIDDDPLVRMTWQVAAAEAEKRIRAFASPAAFFEEARTIDRKTLVYIDQKLGDGELGHEVSERIHDLGFTEIYLATSHRNPPNAKHVKAVVGKAPPWAKEPVTR